MSLGIKDNEVQKGHLEKVSVPYSIENQNYLV